VDLNLTWTTDTKNFLRIWLTNKDQITSCDSLTIFNYQLGTLRNWVFQFFSKVVAYPSITEVDIM
jgi:hypothetical protein